jgi:hypothetical protein
VLSYTRLTAAEALQQLRAQGFPEEQLPSPSTMAEVLNRNGRNRSSAPHLSCER